MPASLHPALNGSTKELIPSPPYTKPKAGDASRIKVAIRIRPMLESEVISKDHDSSKLFVNEKAG
jgi:hypothetical protein